MIYFGIRFEWDEAPGSQYYHYILQRSNIDLTTSRYNWFLTSEECFWRLFELNFDMIT